MILIKPSIDPVIFSIGIIDFRWYSLAYIVGFVVGVYLIKYLNKTSKNILSNTQIDNFFLWSVLGIILGGRLGYVFFYQIEYFLTNPSYIYKIWLGGMSFHGGLIGIIISMYFYCKIYKIEFFYLSDLVSIVAPIGLFFGRIANFINNELYGRKTDFAFAIIYPEIDNHPRHPSQIYESILEGIILFLILYIYFIINKSKINYGKISALFLILYSIFRILVEFLREPDSQIGLIFNSFTLGQFLCIPFIIVGILIYKKNEFQKKNH